MSRRLLPFTLAALLLNIVAVYPADLSSKDGKEARFIARVKEGVHKLGTGEGARIEVKLRDKTKLKGFVKEATDEGFVVVDATTGVATTVAYPQVKQAKGNNLSTGAKVAIGVSVTLAALLLLWLIVASSD